MEANFFLWTMCPRDRDLSLDETDKTRVRTVARSDRPHIVSFCYALWIAWPAASSKASKTASAIVGWAWIVSVM